MLRLSIYVHSTALRVDAELLIVEVEVGEKFALCERQEILLKTSFYEQIRSAAIACENSEWMSLDGGALFAAFRMEIKRGRSIIVHDLRNSPFS